MKRFACIKFVYLTVFSCLIALMLLTSTTYSASAAQVATQLPGKTATSQRLPSGPQGPRLVRRWQYKTVYVRRRVPVVIYQWKLVPVTVRTCVYTTGYYSNC